MRRLALPASCFSARGSGQKTARAAPKPSRKLLTKIAIRCVLSTAKKHFVMSSEPDDLHETGARRSTRTTARVNSQRRASSRPTAGKAVGKSIAKAAKPLEPTTRARRALAARAAGSESIGPTAAQLLAAEEARRAAVESKAQLAGLLASEVDRGDELSAEVARASTAAARWERKYAALKEGVDNLVSSVRDERARVHAARAAMESSLASMPQSYQNVTLSRASSRSSASPFATNTNNRRTWAPIMRIETSLPLVYSESLVAPARTNARIRTTTTTAIAMMAKATAEGRRVIGPLRGSVTS